MDCRAPSTVDPGYRRRHSRTPCRFCHRLGHPDAATETLRKRVERSMSQAFLSHLSTELERLKSAGLYKSERVITSTQSSEIEVAGGGKVLNFCANNYLGLA